MKIIRNRGKKERDSEFEANSYTQKECDPVQR